MFVRAFNEFLVRVSLIGLFAIVILLLARHYVTSVGQGLARQNKHHPVGTGEGLAKAVNSFVIHLHMCPVESVK